MELEQALEALRNASDAADRGVPGAANDARELARIVQQIQRDGPSSRPGNMAQLNRGIAESVGGLVDFVNPFNDPAWEGTALQTGSATEGITNAMEAANIAVTREQPDGFIQGAFRGAGQAAGGAIPAAAAARGLSAAPVIGQFADDVFSSLATRGGLAAEVTAGGASGGAAEQAEQMGAPPWIQNTAAVVAPLGIAAVPSVARQTARVVPSVVGANALRNRLQATLAPYTRGGSYEVARTRMQELAGGEERARELGQLVTRDNEFGLSPAQQTGDPNMLAIEQTAASQNPVLRERLDAQLQESSDRALGAIQDMGGDFEATRRFFTNMRAQFGETLAERVRGASEAANARLEKLGPRRAESDNGAFVTEEIRVARDNAMAEESKLWEAIPEMVQVDTRTSRETAQRVISETSRAQQADIPLVLRRLLAEGGEFGDSETIREMHGLYSELRRLSRVFRAGQAPNTNAARIADTVAEALLRDMGAIDGTTQIGQQINEARAFSSALHETFDRGAVGRILRRTADGDTATDPELSLSRTVGRAGTQASVAARQIEIAAPAAEPAIRDFIMRRFTESAISPTGEFTRASAHRFIRDNSELLQRYPDLRDDITGAVGKRDAADLLAARASDRIAEVSGARTNAAAGFINGQRETAIRSIIDAPNPMQAARRIALEARRDTSGEALAGVKGVFSDELIRRALRTDGGSQFPSGDRLVTSMSDPRFQVAMRQVFSNDEISRLESIIAATVRMDAARTDAPSIGPSLSGASANRALEYVVRVFAARVGAEMGGGGGGSLQTAQMASSRARDMLRSLTADRASQLLADAVEDPELFRALLTDTASGAFEQRVVPRLLPYLTGVAVSTATEERTGPQ